MSYSTTYQLHPRSGRGDAIWALLAGMAAGTAALLSLGLEAKWAVFAILGLGLPFVGALSGDLRRFLLALMLFTIPLNADVHLFYRPEAAGTRGLVIAFPDLCLLVLVAVWLIEVASGLWQQPIRWVPKVTVPYLALLTMAAFSALWAPKPLLTLFDVWQMSKVLVLFHYLVNTVRDRDEVEFVVKLLLIGAALQGVVVLLQNTTGLSLGFFGQETRAELFRPEVEASLVKRPGGTVGHANTLGRYFVLLLPTGIFLVLRGERKRVLCMVTTGLGLLGMILTLSRSAWIGLAFALVIAWVVQRRRKAVPRPRKTFGLVAVLVILGVAFGPMVYRRMVSPDFGATMSRLTTAKVSLRVIRDHPFLGVGMNNYKEVLDTYFDPSDPFTRVAPVHNLYLLYAGELGLVGLALFVWLMLSVLRLMLPGLRARDPLCAATAVGLFAGFAAMLVMATSDYAYKQSLALMNTMWVVAALGLVVARLAQAQAEVQRAAKEVDEPLPMSISRQLLALAQE
ncbi:MAG: O-antigen ligase family protein [bacterium]|nr:O-antigen ligase family protein [candidate division KSB1 bacterium]MDH7558845.1 O-antigen ligase family protein [bacterium]